MSMTNRAVLFLLTVVLGLQLHAQRPLATTYDREILGRLLPAPQTFHPVPTANEGYWQAHVPEEMRKAYIEYAEQYLGKAWKEPARALFAEFKANGNRTHYETESFALRQQLANLVMAEVMEQRGRFTADIVRGLHYFATETWWGIPAHYPTDAPEAQNQVVDLFNAETANLLAWTVYMLQQQLNEAEEGLCDMIKGEISRRVLLPALQTDYWWKHRTSNWNTWICENWLSCVLLCEADRGRQVETIWQILQCLDAFYTAYPDDGGCNEGIAYWDRAAGSFSECLTLLGLATHEQLRLEDDAKFRNMTRYVCATYIGNNAFVNFADASTYTRPSLYVLFPMGSYLHDPVLTGFAAMIARDTDYFNRPDEVFSTQEIPPLSRELLFLSNVEEYKKVAPSEPLLRDNYLPNLQIMTARSQAGSSKGLFVAVKGGHNGEEHNHNDVGSLVVYADGSPVVVDIGRGTYTAQAGTRRYELVNMRSAYHNLPLVNGREQREGKQYRATILDYQNAQDHALLSLNLTDAYPKEASLSNWTRTVRLNRGRDIVVCDSYQLSQYTAPTELIFITCGSTEMVSKGRIAVTTPTGKVFLDFDPTLLTPKIEEIDLTDPLIVKNWRQQALHRVRLAVKGRKRNHTLTTTISQ